MNAYHTDLSMRALWVSLAGALVAAGCTPAPKPVEPPPPAPLIERFTITPAEVNAGGTVKLEWSTLHATSMELEQVNKGLVSGADALSGTVEVAVDEDALFVLTAKNERGVTVSAAVAADVIDAADEVLFVASPPSVNAGEPVTLAWSADEARSVSLAVKDGAQLDIGDQLESGAITVIPAADTTWVLTVDGQSYEASVQVLPVVNVFTVSPEAVDPGETLTVAWKTSGAGKVTVSRAADGVVVTETDAARVADGTFTWQVPASIDPAAAITFVLTAESASGRVTEPSYATAYVTGTPRIRKLTVPTYALSGGTFEVSWLTSGADKVQVIQDGVVVTELPSTGLLESGSARLSTPAQDTVVQVRALSSRGGEHTSAAHTVSPVGVPSVNSFAASTQSINNGGDLVTLTWNVPSARKLEIVANGQYAVARVSGPAAETGSIEVYPNEDTEYRLVADNGLGDEVSATSGLVTVANKAGLVFSPGAAPIGGKVELTGTTVQGSGAMRAVNFVVKNAPGEAFVDISGTGTKLPFMVSDHSDVTKMIALSAPFETELFGNPVGGQMLSVSVNGWLMFSPEPVIGPVTPPASLPHVAYQPYAIIPYGRRLRVSATSNVYWADQGTGASRRIIVQWDDLEHYGSTTKRITAQVQLYADRIVFAYPALSSNLSANDKPIIGVVNGDESVALVPSADLLTNGLPSVGDTLTFWGPVPSPFNFVSNGTPLQVDARVGSGFIRLSGAPTVIPPAQLTITEVNNHPASGRGEWIELQSNVNTPVDLEGWVINFGTSQHPIAGSLVLPPQGRLLLGQDADAAEASSGGPAIDYVYGNTSSLPDGAGSVSIDVAGVTYATFAWTTQRPAGVAFQSGLPAPGVLYVGNPTRVPCSANQAYGANGQLGTPGQPNSACTYPYAKSMGTPNSFISLASSPGSQVIPGLSGATGTDTRVVQITLPRPVPYFGFKYPQLSVDANGIVSAVTQSSSFPNNPTAPATAAPNGVIAPFWDDLLGNTGGAVRWQQFDPDATPLTGDEYTVIAWEDWRISGVTSSLNFEVVFLEGTGDIQFRYGNMTSSDTGGARAKGSSATTWLEDFGGTSVLPHNINSATAPGIAPNTTIHFTAQ